MKNFNKVLLMAALLAGLSSCKDRACISGQLETMPEKGAVILLKAPSGSELCVVDSAKAGSDGVFRFKVKLQKNQPEFYYLYRGDDKLSSLILEKNAKVNVSCDTLGRWTVEGSADCDSLRVWEMMFSHYLSSGPKTAQEFVAFHRRAVMFILGNSTSLSAVPALMARPDGHSLFGRGSDGILFAKVAEKLKTRYPESRYVNILMAESAERQKYLNLDDKFAAARSCDFPELTYPDINGQNVSLTKSLGTKTLLVFWDASDATHKIFNQDVLKPLYKELAPRGLSVYAVGVGTDKPTWAGVVRSQELPWTNVCDVKGSSVPLYAVTQLPTMFVIDDKGITRISDATKLKSILNK